MRPFLIPFVLLVISVSVLVATAQRHGMQDPCDAYGDCASASIAYSRANPDDSLYLGDQFSVAVTASPRSGSSSGTSWVGSLQGIAWSYDSAILNASLEGPVAHFEVVGNATGSYTVTATALFQIAITTCSTSSSGQTTCSTSITQTSLAVSEVVSVRAFVLVLRTTLVNDSDSYHHTLRNPDGSFYRNDSFCDSWNATFQFATERTDIKVNVTSITPESLQILNHTAESLGRTGRFCFIVRASSAYAPSNLVLIARALNWQGTSLGLKDSRQPFAVVQYNPEFTSYAYMMYRNSTASSSLERPWVLLVRYDGNLPGYSYAGDANTHSFNGSRNLAERAFFSDFRYNTSSYQPNTSSGSFSFRMTNSTGTTEYNWLNQKDSAPLYYANRIEKFAFNTTAASLSPLLAQGFVYQNITMIGCWQHESVCDLEQNYWLVPFLWNGRLSIVSIDSNGNKLPRTPITVTIRNSAPLDVWLTGGFEHVFGNDSEAIKAFEADLYATDQTMSFNGAGSVSLLLNQTSLSPPTISITAGGVSLVGNFTFVPTFMNTPILSVPNSLNGTIFRANATIPLWSYNIVRGELAYLPISTTIDYPSVFLELVNSSGWLAGNTTAPQTPSAFASQQYGFWPLGANLTIYANLQGGGIKLVGTQKLAPNDYRASFYVEPWSGGISSLQLLEGNSPLTPQSTLNPSSYPSPLPEAMTGLYTIPYSATGEDTKVVFTNVWGATTTVDLGITDTSAPLLNLVPVTGAAIFGFALIAWLMVRDIPKMRKTETRQ